MKVYFYLSGFCPKLKKKNLKKCIIEQVLPLQ